MNPATIPLDAVNPVSFVGSDGRLELDVPAGAVSATDLTIAGGSLSLRLRQIAPPSGGTGGGSGRYSFGTYLVHTVDASNHEWTEALRQPVTFRMHLSSEEHALGLRNPVLVFNGSFPSTTNFNPDPTGPLVSAAQAALSPTTAVAASYDASADTLVATASLAPDPTLSFNTDSPVATFGKPDIFNADLNAGALSATVPIDVPSGPGGFKPPIALNYTSAGVNEQHNPQGAASWVGEGWTMSLGSITWAEHNVAASQPTPNWESSWQLNDAFGTSSELIPPTTYVSTFCGADQHPPSGLPLLWHTALESHVVVLEYQGGQQLPCPRGSSAWVPCFRVFLPNGIMEEFGCLPSSNSMQWYPQANGSDAVFQWLLDLIVDAHGNQIHLTYRADQNPSQYNAPRDIELQTVEWDSPGCRTPPAPSPPGPPVVACAPSGWNPLMRVNFVSDHAVAHVFGSSCPANGSLRCDDPIDLSGSNGLVNPTIQNTFVLNDVKVEVWSGGQWNTLRDYQLSYEQTAPTTITDPATGKQESTAGKLNLTRITEVGDDGSTSLPTRTFSYQPLTNWYEDEAYTANGNCGPGWNVGCLLWSQSYAGNGSYLASAANGRGLTQTFSWNLARNNTHVQTTDPFYCNSHWSAACNKADSQNWSRVVLVSQSGSVLPAPGASPVTGTTSYTYTLAAFVASPCSDCTVGYYWGNQKDGDFLDYYNGKFMGFAQATVVKPDNALEIHKYHSTLGWGVYDTGQIDQSYCASPCHSDPWWPLPGQSIVNAAHGHEYEADFYDTNQTTLLAKTVTAYYSICPPSGVSGSPSDGHGSYDGQLVSELDPSNPVGVCDILTSRVDRYTYDGSTASNVPDRTSTYLYDSYGRVTKETTTSNDGANQSAMTVIRQPTYLTTDTVLHTGAPPSGKYFINFPSFDDIEDANGNRLSCVYTSHSRPTDSPGPDPTEVDRYANCGTPANGFTDKTGLMASTRFFDSYGNPVGGRSPDANAPTAPGVIGTHTSCAVGGLNGAYTTCTTFDPTFQALATTESNAVPNQTVTMDYSSTSAANGFGLWPQKRTGINGEVTAASYDPFGRVTSLTLPAESSAWTSSTSYTMWCAGAAAQAPCVEVDQIQRLTSTTTVTSRSFYDGWGHLVETRTPGPDGSTDVIRYLAYDASNRQVKASVSYYVAAYSGSPGAAAFSSPDATQKVTASTYDGLGRTLTTTDALGNRTTAIYSVVCNAPQTDAACYEQTLTVDPLGHQTGALVDALGRTAYVQRYTGNSLATYGLYATASYQYDAAGNLQQIVEPAGGGSVLMTYDTAGRKTQVSDPDTGTTTYAYDPDGNLYKSIDARGAPGTTWTGYDNLDRPIWRNSQNSPMNPTAHFVYDTGTNGQGRLAHEDFTGAPANNLSGSYDYTYDARGRLASSTLTLPGLTPYVTSTTYDDADHVLSQGYPDQETVQPGYSATGWLSSLATTPPGGSSITLLNAATYTFAPTASPPQFGGPAQLLTAAGLGGGSFQYRATYDARLRPTDLKLTNGTGSTTYFEQARTFDGAGNVTSANTTLPAGTDNQAFCYDEQNRLTWAQANNETSPCTGIAGTPGTLSSAQYRQGFGYDTLGRLTSIGLLFNSWHYAYGDLAHPHGVTSIYYNLRGSPITIYSGRYDPAGNMICRDPSSTNCSGGTNTGAQLSYSTTGRLVGWQNTPTNPTATAGFLYDAEGNRVEQQITQSGSTTTIVYVGNLEQDTINGSTTTKSTFYYAGGRRIATALNLAATPPGPISYLGSDGLGSADVAVRASDSSTTSVLYAPYGAVRYSSGTMPADYGFTGQHADAATGLDYYNARYYDPVAGQFTSADSILPGKGYDVWGLSRYAYVEGNPVIRTDPNGHSTVLCDSACPNSNSMPIATEPSGACMDLTCSLGSFQNMSVSERQTYLSRFQSYWGSRYNFSGSFNNIEAVLRFLQENQLAGINSWVGLVDATILKSVNDGLALALNRISKSDLVSANAWATFFAYRINLLGKPESAGTTSQSNRLWGRAELDATTEGESLAARKNLSPTQAERWFTAEGDAFYRGPLANWGGPWDPHNGPQAGGLVLIAWALANAFGYSTVDVDRMGSLSP